MGVKGKFVQQTTLQSSEQAPGAPSDGTCTPVSFPLPFFISPDCKAAMFSLQTKIISKIPLLIGCQLFILVNNPVFGKFSTFLIQLSRKTSPE